MERLREAVRVILILLLVAVPSVFLFFIDGGQIHGINYNPETIPILTDEVDINGVIYTVLEEDIEPIYDGTEIINVELWQLPPRDIILRFITYPMAYIPPSFSKLLSLLYLSIGFGFVILYRKKKQQKTACTKLTTGTDISVYCKSPMYLTAKYCAYNRYLQRLCSSSSQNSFEKSGNQSIG
ncbi:MAG: hypothetical protein Q4Q53_04495 [Methanocorpusculum sp.]|nr:hypothetical protein [Methanocorpusculum sp.]